MTGLRPFRTRSGGPESTDPDGSSEAIAPNRGERRPAVRLAMVRRDELLPPRDEGRPSRRCTEASGARSIRGPVRAARFRPRPCGIRRNLARCFEVSRAHPEFRSCPIAPRGKAAHGTVVEHARGRIEDAPRSHVGSDARSVGCDRGDRVVPWHVLTSPSATPWGKVPNQQGHLVFSRTGKPSYVRRIRGCSSRREASDAADTDREAEGSAGPLVARGPPSRPA
jgi:hypothetical protein